MGVCSSSRSVQVHPTANSSPTTAVVPCATPAEPAHPGSASASGSTTAPKVAAAEAASAPATGTITTQPLGSVGGSVPAEVQEPVCLAPAQQRKPKKSLIKAAKDGNLSVMDELLAEGCELEDKGMWDNTPLLAACMYGKNEAAMKLIGKKADVSVRNEYGATPLHYAAVEGSLGVLEALLASKAAASSMAPAKGMKNDLYEDGGTDGAIHNGATGGAKDVDYGHATMPDFVNCGLARVYNRHLDAYGERDPLGAASESGFVDIVGKLLTAGAEIEAKNEGGRTALWLASRFARTSVVRFLLQQGADTSVKDADGVSVLGAATGHHCNEELVLAILSHGVADVNDNTHSPLRQAVKARKRSVAEALLTHGASVQPRAGDGKATALLAACENGDEHLVTLLMRARADPSDADAAGKTAFDLLRKKGFLDGQIVTLLQAPTGGTGSGDGCTGATGETGDAQESPSS